MNDRTDPCPVGTDGCYCGEDPPCQDDLVCDGRDRTCRVAVACDELECPPHRLCVEAADGRDAYCSDSCEAGWTFSRVSSTCAPLPPSCDPESVTSIVADCEAAQRECVEIAGRGRCGACVEGFVNDGEDPGGACVPAPVCDDEVVAGCTAEGRVCREGTCAECLPSHLEDGDVCVPTNCGGEGVAGGIGDACAALMRACEASSVEGPTGDIEVAACGACLTAHLPTDPVDPDAGACRPVETCASLACGEKSRLCVAGDTETDATCGVCRAGFRDIGGRCRPIEGAFCEGEGDPANIAPDCAADGRVCDPAGPLGARCGDCMEGRVPHPDTGECVEPMDCATLGCEAEGRACAESPTAVCEGCLDHLVEDDAGFCREPFTCGDLSCGRLECQEAPMGAIADARCVTPCREDQLWNGRECAPCPPCDGEGLVGVERRPTLAGWCICETEPGWFYSTANEVGPVPCDSDGDGWVRENARQVFESGDAVLIDNARCALREIDRVVLRDEADAVVETVLLDAPLPLYESVRNDDDATLREDWARAELPDDAWGPEGVGVSAALLNPFTKLCHDPRADYNHNGHADAYEYGSAPLSPGFRADQRPFNTFSYFLELHRGWFEPLGGDPDQGAWHIAERTRAASDTTPVPIRYAGDADWWQSCTRRADPDLDQEPPIGMDFRAEGLTHHSQFKCVVVRDVPDAAQPLEMTPADAEARFELNDCVASEAPTPGEGTNPAEPAVTCAPRATAPPPGTALWGAVPYAGYQSNPVHAGYAGGCVNTCAEAMYRHAANENDLMCPGLPVNVPACLGLDADFGRLECLEVPCDQIDNDDDGQTDEDPPATCPTGLLGVCADGAPRCEGTTLRCNAPDPTNEICDGLDNDCDGTVDEDSSGVPCAAESPSTGLPGVPGLPGVCGMRSTQCIDGVLDCLPDEPYEPVGETTCDGHDNDCDGQVDEGLAGVPVPGQPEGIDYGSGCHTPGENYQGACAETTWQCVGGETVCAPAADPAPEGCPDGAPAGCRRICDGVDNDCDGQTDEDGACLRTWSSSLNLNALLRADDANMGGSRVTMNVSVVFGGQGSDELSTQMTIEALEQYSRPTEGFIERARTTTVEGTIAQFVGGNRFSVTYIDGDDDRDIIKRPGTNPARNPFENNVQRVQDHDAVTHLHCNGRVPGAEDVLSQAGSYRNDRVGCELRFSVDYIIVPPENPCLGD
ncbi:MAG: MopE-related protein, partial [Planctomycetota bacterium]